MATLQLVTFSAAKNFWTWRVMKEDVAVKGKECGKGVAQWGEWQSARLALSRVHYECRHAAPRVDLCIITVFHSPSNFNGRGKVCARGQEAKGEAGWIMLPRKCGRVGFTWFGVVASLSGPSFLAANPTRRRGQRSYAHLVCMTHWPVSNATKKK